MFATVAQEGREESREESCARALGGIEPKCTILTMLGNGACLGFSAASSVLSKFGPELKGNCTLVGGLSIMASLVPCV